MRGMMSVDESKFPALFILDPPEMVHTFLDSKGVAWHTKESRFKMPGYEIHFLCIVCQLTGRVKHKPIELKIPSKEFANFMRKAATPIKIACALLRLGILATKIASGGLVPIPLSILTQTEEMGAMCDNMCELSINAVNFADVSIAENELGEKVNSLSTPCVQHYLQHCHHLICNVYAQSGQQKLDKLDQMKKQMQAAEQKADVKTSRLLLDLLDKFSDVKNRDGPAIKQLANLYRCIHKDKATVIWISDDADALGRAKKLGFDMADLHAGQMEPDESVPFQRPEPDRGEPDQGPETETSEPFGEPEGNGAGVGASFAPTATQRVDQGATQSKGCTIL
jgi:hypothetical protein